MKSREGHLHPYFCLNIPASSQLRAELSRLQELKQQNMARFINQLRRELETWWEKCYITDEEKNAFLPYLSGKSNWNNLMASYFFFFSYSVFNRLIRMV